MQTVSIHMQTYFLKPYRYRVDPSTPESNQASHSLRGKGNIILSKIDRLKIAPERNRMPISTPG